MFRMNRTAYRRVLAPVVACVVMGILPVETASASVSGVWWVATTGTAGAGTSCSAPDFVGTTHVALQAAIDAAAAGDEIRVCSGTYDIGATLRIDKNLIISGQSYPLPILDGDNSVRIMDITSAGDTVTVDRLHFRNGRVSGDDVRGGAIRLNPSAHLRVTDSLFVNNRSMNSHGGAIATTGTGSEPGTLTISGSTFYSNHGLDGGAIMAVFTSGASTISNSTFVENTAVRSGGAISGSFAVVTATNSTFIDNSAGDGGDATWAVALKGSLISNSSTTGGSGSLCYYDDGQARQSNVSSDASCIGGSESTVTHESLQLSFLAPWGGNAPTVKIGSGSSARNTVASGLCTSTDQRGSSRSGVTCDAGAFEYVDGLPTLSTSSEITLVENRSVDLTPVFASVGLVSPIQFRVAAEIVELPDGVMMATNGRISGTPEVTTSAPLLVVTAIDANGAMTSAQMVIDNCLLTEQSGSFLVSSASDLNFFRFFACGFDADYVQTTDIGWDDVWDDTSTMGDPFTGSYDGGGFSISGLQIEGGQTAFIARTDGASITDLSLDVEVSGAYGSAGLVGYAISTTIEDVHVSGSITTPVAEGNRGCLGGLAGETESTSIRRSSFEGTVSDPSGSWNGGLIGCAYSNSSLESSYFSGTVEGVDSIGGLVGWMDQTDISDSYAVGTVTGSGVEIGGLVGYQSGDASDADSIALTNSYASTAVSGSSSVGALIGIGVDNAISGSVWQAELSGSPELNPLGAFQSGTGSQPAIAALTAGEMKAFSTFNDAGWGIVNGWESAATSSNTWGLCSASTRPYLLWEHASSPCAPLGGASSGGADSTPPSPTTTQSPNTQSPAPRTSVAGQPVGGAEIMVDGQRLSVALAWASDNTIRGTIGGVNIALQFEEGLTSPDLRPVIVRGRSFRLSLRGLRPESVLSATIFSRPTRLGTFTVNGDGTIKKVVAVPSNRALGLHRLRIKMVDQAGREITLWLGIHVRGAKALGSARVK